MEPGTPLPGSPRGPAANNRQALGPGGASFHTAPLNGMSSGSRRGTATVKHNRTLSFYGAFHSETRAVLAALGGPPIFPFQTGKLRDCRGRELDRGSGRVIHQRYWPRTGF